VTLQTSLLQGDALVHHVDILEQLLEEKLTTLRSIGPANTPDQRRYEQQLLIDLGLIASELRSIAEADDAVPF
jgi:hypothetical protein